MGDLLHLDWARLHREGGTSWRPYSEGFWWQHYDAVIASERASLARSYDVYTYGHLVAPRPSIQEAKDYVEDVYGPQEWRTERLPPVKVDHPLGPTTEFTDPRMIYVVDVLPILGRAASNRSPLRRTGD